MRDDKVLEGKDRDRDFIADRDSNNISIFEYPAVFQWNMNQYVVSLTHSMKNIYHVGTHVQTIHVCKLVLPMYKLVSTSNASFNFLLKKFRLSGD